jgi:hypothetical protein
MITLAAPSKNHHAKKFQGGKTGNPNAIESGHI